MIFESCVTCAAVAVWAVANEPLNIAPATTAMAIFRIKSSFIDELNARNVTLK